MADWFVHSVLRGPDERHPMPLNIRTGIRDQMVLSAVAEMAARPDDPLTTAELAALRRRVGGSP